MSIINISKQTIAKERVHSLLIQLLLEHCFRVKSLLLFGRMWDKFNKTFPRFLTMTGFYMSFNWRVFSNRLEDLNLNGSNLQVAEGTT